MAIKFIIDSSSDILPAEAESLGVIHMPLTVRFGTEEYLDGIDLTHREFYEKLIESDVLPATSQITPAAFDEVFAKVCENGDTAIVITISSSLSGTFQSANIAAQKYGDKVKIIDSESVCVGERILLERALELARDESLTPTELVTIIENEKKHVRVLALLDTLEYLRKGGRISSATAFAGSILGIKPVITVDDGEVALIGKARGSKMGNNLLRELISKVGGIDFSKPFALAYSGLSDNLLQKYVADSYEIWGEETEMLPIYTVGSVIGAHAGPGAIALAFFESSK